MYDEFEKMAEESGGQARPHKSTLSRNQIIPAWPDHMNPL
jgi:hypothetical protein